MQKCGKILRERKDTLAPWFQHCGGERPRRHRRSDASGPDPPGEQENSEDICCKVQCIENMRVKQVKGQCKNVCATRVNGSRRRMTG